MRNGVETTPYEPPASVRRAPVLPGGKQEWKAAMTDVGTKLYPVLLSGGAGVRLWPVSRRLAPKQLLPLASERPMLQETAARVADPARYRAPIVICNEEHRFIIAEQLRQMKLASTTILEPVGRNTAPAVAVAALHVVKSDPDGLLLVLPADHVIRDDKAFQAAVDAAAAAAAAGRLVTFGIQPDRPETGYGYIRRGAAADGLNGVYAVDRFVEKPDAATAQTFLAAGDYYWNSGMFVLPAALYLQELARFEPEMPEICRRALESGAQDLDFFRLDAKIFAQAPSNSIDYAVMERTDKAAVAPVDMGWTDVGSWSALWDIAEKDADGNARLGDVVVMDARNCYVRSEGKALTAVLGLDDVIVVATEDAVLVAAKDRAQDVKKLVDKLKQDGRSEPDAHVKVHRPWGFYQQLHGGDRFQVKRLTVNPGASLSLQKHFHRAEHWVVVNGTALVTRDGEKMLLHENESIYLPLGAVHRLENPGKIPLNLIEVQSGSYLGEDDIVRLEDYYQRS